MRTGVLIFFMYRHLLLYVVLSIMVAAGLAVGQTATVKGTVQDSANLPIAGAVVVLRNRSTGLERLTNTDVEGKFSFGNLNAAGYEIIATATGFGRRSQAVEINGSEILVMLEPEQFHETVTVISGSRQAELQESLNTAVEVVTRREIDSKGYQTVGEVLKEVPGVQTRLGSDTGTVSGIAGEQIQGVGSRQSLVLLDGFPIIAARGIKSGTINLDRQSTGKIEQVEVVKGAASALYGSDAIGGVVNLISR